MDPPIDEFGTQNHKLQLNTVEFNIKCMKFSTRNRSTIQNQSRKVEMKP